MLCEIGDFLMDSIRRTLVHALMLLLILSALNLAFTGSQVRADQNRLQECGLRSRWGRAQRAVSGLLPAHRSRHSAAEVGLETSAAHKSAIGERMSGR